MRFRVGGDTLRVDSRERVGLRAGRRITSTTPRLARLEIDGAQDVGSAGVQGSHLSAAVDVAADTDVTGSVDVVGVRIGGATDVRFGSLQARVDIDGSGAVVVKRERSRRRPDRR